MLLVVDNHDSFTWNLVHALGRYASDVEVAQGDEISLDEARRLAPRAIVLTPGPGRPEQAGIGIELVRALGPHVPMLGVCLGHQIICAALGARVTYAPRLMHGRTSAIHHDGQGVFAGLPSPLSVARYHSLVVDAASLPTELVPTAFTSEGELMAVRHVTWAVEGVQFHPESFMTERGLEMVQRFVERLSLR